MFISAPLRGENIWSVGKLLSFVLPAHRKHFSSARDAPPKKRKLFRKGLAVTVNFPRTAAGGGVGCEKGLESFRGEGNFALGVMEIIHYVFLFLFSGMLFVSKFARGAGNLTCYSCVMTLRKGCQGCHCHFSKFVKVFF